MFNALDHEHMFPFQTVDWPAIPARLIYIDQQANPPPPPAARPVPAELRAFMVRVASKRGEYDGLVKGYYFAADLIGCQFVTYNQQLPGHEDDPPPIMSLVIPFHECFARIDYQRPHDLNAVVRMICRMDFPASDQLAPELAVIQDASSRRLALAAMLMDVIISVMTTTQVYSFQWTGHDLQRAASPGTLPDWTQGPLLTNPTNSEATLPVLFLNTFK